MKDLAWWLVLDEHFSAGVGLARLEGLGSRQETIDLWEELTGKRAGDLRWYEVFAKFQIALLTYRGWVLENGVPEDWAVVHNPFFELALEQVGDTLSSPFEPRVT